MGRHSRKNRQPRVAPELRARLHQAIPSVGANVRVFATRDGTGYFVDGKGVQAGQAWKAVVGGHKVQLVILDDASDPATAARNARSASIRFCSASSRPRSFITSRAARSDAAASRTPSVRPSGRVAAATSRAASRVIDNLR